jgi:hypothetical protein
MMLKRMLSADAEPNVIPAALLLQQRTGSKKTSHACATMRLSVDYQ